VRRNGYTTITLIWWFTRCCGETGLPSLGILSAPGEFGTSPPYYNDYRWQRQPAESLGIARNFVINRERNISFQIRAEFQNVFNRLFLSSPIPVYTGFPAFPSTAGANPVAPVTKDSFQRLTGGYGYVNWFNGGNTPTTPTAGAQPRSGQIVGRLTF